MQSDRHSTGPGRTTVLVLLLVWAWSTPALGQVSGTGTLRSLVIGPDGAPLPGVQVSVEGPLGTNFRYTVIDGTARALGLAPGKYTATYRLDGFTTVVREGLRVSVGQSTLVTLNMVRSVEETVTITGQS